MGRRKRNLERPRVKSARIDRLRTVRKRMKIRQKEMAADIGCSRQHLSEIENGTKRASEALKLKMEKYLRKKGREIFP